MAAPEGAPKVKTLVTAAPLHVRYNSRLPIVVYAPSGYEVRYRIWSASETTHKAGGDKRANPKDSLATSSGPRMEARY